MRLLHTVIDFDVAASLKSGRPELPGWQFFFTLAIPVLNACLLAIASVRRKRFSHLVRDETACKKQVIQSSLPAKRTISVTP